TLDLSKQNLQVEWLRNEDRRSKLLGCRCPAWPGSRDHEDGYSREIALALPPSQEGAAIHVGQHHVEEDQVGHAAMQLGERLYTSGRQAHRVAGVEQSVGEHRGDRRIVFNDQQLRHESAPRSRPWSLDVVEPGLPL